MSLCVKLLFNVSELSVMFSCLQYCVVLVQCPPLVDTVRRIKAEPCTFFTVLTVRKDQNKLTYVVRAWC